MPPIRPIRAGSFVDRFLATRGPGLHHWSLEAAGVRVVDKRELRNGQKTAFISPRSAYGVLIQLWETPEPRSAGSPR